MIGRLLVLTLVVCAAGAGAGAQTPVAALPVSSPTLDAAELQAFVRTAAEKFSAPGLAVAVVKDGGVLMSRGFGVRRAGEPAPVDEHTLFYTASATKAFTVTALGVLADEGRLRIDDPVVRHLPEFAVADPALTSGLTIRDLMAHRTGLPRADMLLAGGLSSEDVLHALSKLAPQAPVRSRFGYQNQMYLVLGEILERLSGSSWARFVEDRVLGPVGFRDGNAAGLGHWQGRPAATPHARRTDGTPATIDLVPRDPYGAGGVNASAADMAAWLAFQLGDGSANGKRIVGANVLAAEHAPNTLVPPNASMPSATLSAYGLGWFIHDYFGQKVVQHGGNGEGWTSLVLLVPGRRLGVAVLANVHNSAAPTAIAYGIVDRVLGRTPRNWIGEYAALEARMVPPPLPAAPPDMTGPTAAAGGTYEHPVFGRATLDERDGRLTFTYGTLTGAIDGTRVTWTRSDMAAVLGAGRISVRDEAGSARLLLEVAGERVEFTRIR